MGAFFLLELFNAGNAAHKDSGDLEIDESLMFIVPLIMKYLSGHRLFRHRLLRPL